MFSFMKKHWLVLTAALIFAVSTIFAVLKQPRPNKQYIVESDEAARELIETTQHIVDYNPLHENGYRFHIPLSEVEQLASRNAPVQYLAEELQIDNIFTFTEEGRAAKFKMHAEHQMYKSAGVASWRTEGDDWSRLQGTIKDIVRSELARQLSSFSLDDFLRTITLKLTLEYMMVAKHGKVDSKVLERVGTSANALCIAANVALPLESLPDEVSLLRKNLRTTLMQDLQQLFPSFDMKDPTSNPLNRILPAYEPMWRALKMGFLELFWRQRVHNQISFARWYNVLKQWKKQSFYTDGNFGGSNNFHRQICAKDIIKEVLRLYPPIPRVRRRFPHTSQDDIADIERCHRNDRLAGPDPFAFRPERWLDIHKEALTRRVSVEDLEWELGFMPFGPPSNHPRSCPANDKEANEFAYKMIAYVLIELLEVAMHDMDGLGEWKLNIEAEKLDIPLNAYKSPQVTRVAKWENWPIGASA